MNIAILTMSLKIGGAETHIFELSCALAAKGHNVTVFSAGGVYADKLEEKGVNHVYAPLNRKDPKSLITSYKMIENYVKTHRPCVIHSHTRISNFTADIIARKYNIPFVSTVHFNFNTGFLQKLCTKWGTRAIAVSDDLKEYAIKNYGFDRDKISVTVNGINLSTFCKTDMSDFKTELGLSKDSKVILCVSRLDDVASVHVKKVLDLSEEIYKKNNNTHIIIVGGGSKAEEFSALAEKINSKTKNDFIKLAGPQTDIYKYCNIADLFIGISRSALEAMACKIPTILLGNSGYIGTFSSKTENDCIETNFTCRGCPYPSDCEITKLISDMLSNPENYRENVDAGYEIVKNRYSVERMANDAVSAYENALKDLRPYDVAICGYYGRHNLGDDVSLKAITENLSKEKSRKYLLLTSNPSEKQEGIEKSLHRFNIIGIAKKLRRTRLFILGGGSILQDATSSRSLYYYLFISSLAKRLGCNVMLYSNGIGPITKPSHRKQTVKLLEKANFITLRDKNSFEYIQKMGVKNKNIEITSDEVFTIDTTKIEKNNEENKKYICVNLRFASSSDAFIEGAAYALNRISKEYGYTLLLLPLHFEQDFGVLCKLSKKLDCDYVLIENKLEHEKTLSLLKNCEFAFIQRLHALIFSIIMEIPFIVTNHDPKITAMCEELSLTEYMVSEKNTDGTQMFSLIKNAIEEKDKIKNILKENTKSKSKAAFKNSEIANKLLD